MAKDVTVKLEKKLEYLMACIKEDAYEDVVGHLCDLLWYFGDKIECSDGRGFKSLRSLVDFYGKNPTPIEE